MSAPLYDAIKAHVEAATVAAPGWRKHASNFWIIGASGDPMPAISQQANAYATNHLTTFALASYEAGQAWRAANPAHAPQSTAEAEAEFWAAIRQALAVAA